MAAAMQHQQGIHEHKDSVAKPTRRNMRRIDVFREVSRSQEWLPYHGEIIKPATARAIVRLYDHSSPKVQRRIYVAAVFRRRGSGFARSRANSKPLKLPGMGTNRWNEKWWRR